MYMIETVKTGKVVEIRKTMCQNQKRKTGRNPKSYPSVERVEKSNARLAERKLRRKINTNFQTGDIFVTLTYGGDKPEAEEAKRDLDNFIRRLRRAYKREGKELKYIAVTEYKANKIHHHLVLNDIDSKIIANCWEKGRPHEVRLDDSGDYGKLAAYLIKETKRSFEDGDEEEEGKIVKSGRRWRQSSNLKPYDKLTRRRVSARKWREEPKPLMGYELNKGSIMTMSFLWNGLMFESQEYYMVEIDPRPRWKRLRYGEDRSAERMRPAFSARG